MKEQIGSVALGALQQDLYRLITDPEGIGVALAAEGDPDGIRLGRLVRGDRGLSSAERVEVYATAYFARIHDCLREDFGALAGALGDEAFHDLAKTYLMMHPPTRFSLQYAGAGLAAHLAAEPFAAIFGERCPYASDLARLEWAMSETFYAADAPALGHGDLAAVAPAAWATLRFEVTPSLRLVACTWPAHAVRERFDREAVGETDGETNEGSVPALAAEPTWLRVWRRGEQVRYRAIPRIEFEGLGAAAAGEPFAAICDRMSKAVGEEQAAPQAAGLLAAWLADGILTGLR